MEEKKGGRFPFHTDLNNLEQVKSCGVCTHAEKIIFDLVFEGCLSSAEMEAATKVSLSSTQPKPDVSIDIR